jgi:hypothetical protein
MSRVRSFASGRFCLLSLLALLWPLAASAQDADHLLLSEVLVRARTPYASFGSPYIEVVNPTAAAFDLTHVHVTNAQDNQLGRYYWNVVGGENAGGGTSSTFHARFPHGMAIAPGQRLVISLAGSAQFQQAYGFLPDLELFEDGTAPDAVPEMVEVFTGSIGRGLGSTSTNTPALNENSDSIMLYFWDGESDTVQDIDYLIWGGDTRWRVDKTTVPGYQPDTPVASQVSAAAGPIPFGESFRRVSFVEPAEPLTGGNGITGHNETGEDLSQSWNLVAGTPPGQPLEPASWHPPAPITLSATAGEATAGAPTAMQAQVVAHGGAPTVVFRYRVDGGAWLDAAATAAGGNNFTAQIAAQAEGAEVHWYVHTTSTGGGVAVFPVEGARAPRSFTVAAGQVDVLEIVSASLLNATAFADLTARAVVEAGSQPITQVTVHYAIDGGAETSEALTAMGGGIWQAVLGQYPAGTAIAWRLVAADQGGGEALWPAGGGTLTTTVLPAGVVCYGWENGDTVLGVFAPDLMYYANTDAEAYEGNRSLEIYKTAEGTTPQAYVAWITDLRTGDDVTASVMTLDLIPGNPSVRIWGHWTPAGGDVDSYAGSASGNQQYSGSEEYEWVELSHTWSVPADRDGQGLVVEIRPYNAPPWEGTNWVDFLCVTAPAHATVHFPGEEGGVEPGDEPQILAAGLQNPYSVGEVVLRVQVLPGADPIDAVTAYYTVDGGPELSLEAAATGGGFWEAVLGEFAAGTVIAWRVTVAAGSEQAVWPADGGWATDTITAPPQAHKLLITEVSILGNDQEYVEIANPNAFDVDLSNYYLTDAIHAPLNQYYWRITEGNPTQQTVGGGDFFDFHARFPDGYTLAAGDTIVVSIAGSQPFYGHFGFLPHIELHGNGPAPRMRPVFGDIDGPNSIVGSSASNPPTLTNTSECVVLYFWDGQSNLVTDIDVFFWGPSTSVRFSKTGVTVGGETYQDETAVADQQPFLEIPQFGFSYHRIDPDETGQPGPPGNGVDGRDEVGEPFASTFAIRAYDPARPREAVGPIGDVALRVPPKTFVPDLEEFVFEFSTRPGYETKLRIFDLDGRLVITLFDSRFAGLPPTQVVWDGRDATFERVRAGMYVIHLQAVDRTTGQKTIKTAPVVVATRLK